MLADRQAIDFLFIAVLYSITASTAEQLFDGRRRWLSQSYGESCGINDGGHNGWMDELVNISSFSIFAPESRF